jgi:hypothetical protein
LRRRSERWEPCSVRLVVRSRASRRICGVKFGEARSRDEFLPSHIGSDGTAVLGGPTNLQEVPEEGNVVEVHGVGGIVSSSHFNESKFGVESASDDGLNALGTRIQTGVPHGSIKEFENDHLCDPTWSVADEKLFMFLWFPHKEWRSKRVGEREGKRRVGKER